MKGKYFLIGLSYDGKTIAVADDRLEYLQETGQSMRYYSIYRNDPEFFSSVQADYLIETDEDPFWLPNPHRKLN